MHASAVEQKVITLINKNPCRVILLRFIIVEISGMIYIFFYLIIVVRIFFLLAEFVRPYVFFFRLTDKILDGH